MNTLHPLEAVHLDGRLFFMEKVIGRQPEKVYF